MLQQHIAEACAEFELPVPKINERKSFPLKIREDIEVEIRDLEPGASFYACICACPHKKKEELFTLLMRANYLGQSTGSSRIGMSADEKYLTLSSGMPYELTYRIFRELLEDFVNFLLYWREEIAKFEAQHSLI